MRNIIIRVVVIIVVLGICGCSFSNQKSTHSENYSETDFPSDTIHVKGEIINYARGYCGIFCLGGMVQVRLDNGYYLKGSSNKIFIVTACENDGIKKGRQIDVFGTKLLSTDTACYYKSFSKVDTFAHTYYKLSEEQTGKIK